MQYHKITPASSVYKTEWVKSLLGKVNRNTFITSTREGLGEHLPILRVMRLVKSLSEAPKILAGRSGKHTPEDTALSNGTHRPAGFLYLFSGLPAKITG